MRAGGDPARQLFAFRGYNTGTLLARNSPFTPAELAALRHQPNEAARLAGAAFAADSAAPAIRPGWDFSLPASVRPLPYSGFVTWGTKRFADAITVFGVPLSKPIEIAGVTLSGALAGLALGVGAAWLAQHFWLHWRHSGDRAVPW